MADKVYKAKQLRRALQLFTQTITDESKMMELADIYPKWDGNSKSYKANTIVSYGVNADGETQLYTVLQDHTSQSDWTPDSASSLFKKVGFTDTGVAIWTQPLGSTDAYMTGDIVEHNGSKWTSTVDNNVWEPGVYGWDVVAS